MLDMQANHVDFFAFVVAVTRFFHDWGALLQHYETCTMRDGLEMGLLIGKLVEEGAEPDRYQE